MTTATDNNHLGMKLEHIGAILLRYGLVVVLLWIGALKFTAYEAMGVKPLVSHSPFLSWGYHVTSVQGFAMLLGVIEIILGIMIAMRAFAPKVSAIGSLGACIMFLITLSLLLTTPGVWQPGYGFPALSPMPGQFIIKDILLLAAAAWTAGEAWNAAQPGVV